MIIFAEATFPSGVFVSSSRTAFTVLSTFLRDDSDDKPITNTITKRTNQNQAIEPSFERNLDTQKVYLKIDLKSRTYVKLLSDQPYTPRENLRRRLGLALPSAEHVDSRARRKRGLSVESGVCGWERIRKMKGWRFLIT